MADLYRLESHDKIRIYGIPASLGNSHVSASYEPALPIRWSDYADQYAAKLCDPRPADWVHATAQNTSLAVQIFGALADEQVQQSAACRDVAGFLEHLDRHGLRMPSADKIRALVREAAPESVYTKVEVVVLAVVAAAVTLLALVEIDAKPEPVTDELKAIYNIAYAVGGLAFAKMVDKHLTQQFLRQIGNVVAAMPNVG
jgi:hypothetical protein